MNLATRYMGLDLKNPLIASASPLTAELGNIRQLEDSGAAAIVLPSIFEEQIEAEARHYDHFISAGSDSFPEALRARPEIIGSTFDRVKYGFTTIFGYHMLWW
jgi:dihydroorotate dehydrogenase (fumarate)